MVTVRDIARVLEKFAPKPLAESYDNVGLQVGRMETSVSGILVALDLTHPVIDESLSAGCNLIVTHHPNIFRPIRSVTSDGYVNGLALRLAENGLAHYATHTNLDQVSDGVSFALGRLLGLEKLRVLSPKSDQLYKLVTFVPETHADAVKMALGDAGAGQIGAYSHCAFTSVGQGSLKPMQHANPFLGAPETYTTVPEIRLEIEIHRWQLGAMLAVLKQTHPYEEVAYDVYAVQQPSTQFGLGAIGTLSEPMALEVFLEHVASKLATKALRFVAPESAQIQTVAVCGGSGSEFMGLALANGADAYVTADFTYHPWFNALDGAGSPRFTVVDAGHYETEWITEQLLLEVLQPAFPDLKILRTQTKTNPTRIHVRQS